METLEMVVIGFLLLGSCSVNGNIVDSGCDNVPECKCYVEPNNLLPVANCSDRHLTAIPSAFPTKQQLYYLKNNSFDLTVPSIVQDLEQTFSQLTVAQYLFLDDNPLKVIPSTLLSSLKYLLYLSLYNTQLKEIRPGAFDSLAILQVLDLRKNFLTTFPADIFINQKELVEIGLQGNELHSLPSDLFNSNSKLYFIDLTRNEMETLPKFDNVNSVQLFYAIQCQLQYVNELHFPNLKDLSLDENNLQTFPPDLFSEMKLRLLDIRRNKINSLPGSLLRDQTSLTHFYISNNQLTELPPDIFTGTKLQTVDLRNNLISWLPATLFQNQTDLANLYMGGNQLTSLPDSLFWGLKKLRELEIRYNDLSEMSSSVFDDFTNHSSLQTIALGGNSFKCDCSLSDFFVFLNALKDAFKTAVECLCTEPSTNKQKSLCSIPENYFAECYKVVTVESFGSFPPQNYQVIENSTEINNRSHTVTLEIDETTPLEGIISTVGGLASAGAAMGAFSLYSLVKMMTRKLAAVNPLPDSSTTAPTMTNIADSKESIGFTKNDPSKNNTTPGLRITEDDDERKKKRPSEGLDGDENPVEEGGIDLLYV